MKEHFGKLRQIMDDYEQQCEENLGQLLSQQEEKIKNIQDGVEGEMDKLVNDEINLNSLAEHDNSEIIYMTNIIDDQHQHLAQEYQPKI
jgi:Skp family chaperone for outer membrane proteins